MTKGERFDVLARIRKELSRVRQTKVCIISIHSARIPLWVRKNPRVSVV